MDFCQICNSSAQLIKSFDPPSDFYQCPVCGRYKISPGFDDFGILNINHLRSFMAYNGFNDDNRYYTTMSKDKCDEHIRSCKPGIPIHLSEEEIENWYPKTFSEKIDYILLYLYNKTEFIGQPLQFTEENICSWLFIDKYEKHSYFNEIDNDVLRIQANYMIKFLEDNNYIEKETYPHGTWHNSFVLSPGGYSRVDELQKNNSNTKNVLVAMKFGDDTRALREAIRTGVLNAQYNPIFIDEVQHNDFITPELLKHIRDSKFVVVDLTHKNNGAYFEEGYAMGLGKPVIQLCNNETKLHFDVAQKNTIIWKYEDDIPDLLKKRIEATID